MRSLWLAKKISRSVALQLLPNPTAKRLDFQIIVSERGGWVDQSNPQSKIENPKFDGTVKRGSATCPFCGYTTPVTRVREQLKTRRGGTNDARLLCVVTTQVSEQGRFYRLPTSGDAKAVTGAQAELDRRINTHDGALSYVPDEKICLNEIRRISLPLYGMTTWGNMFSKRQLLALTTVARLVRELCARQAPANQAIPSIVLGTLLALIVDRLADSLSSSVTWSTSGEFQRNTFARQALAFVSDYAEVRRVAARSAIV